MRSVQPVIILDRRVNLLASIANYESLIFERGYYGIGQFELRINMHKNYTDTLQRGNILVVGNRSNEAVYMILHREVELDERGRITENWLIKGMELKFTCTTRITIPPSHTSHDNKSAVAETVMKHYVQNNVINPADPQRTIDLIHLAADQNRGSHVSWQSRFKNLAEELILIGSFAEIGWKIMVDLDSKQWVFDVMVGRDRSVSQRINPPVIFSPHLGNIENMKFVDSELNYKNFAYVAGQGEGIARRVITVGNTAGLNRYELFVDARDIGEEDEDENPRPEADIIADLNNRGIQKLSELQQELFLTAKIIVKTAGNSQGSQQIEGVQTAFVTQFQGVQLPILENISNTSSFIYQRDWDLGDIVTVENRDWGYTMDTRITLVREIYEPEVGFNLEVVFGNDRPTLITKLRQVIAAMDAEMRR